MSSERPSKHPKSRSVESMRLMGGSLCLDFLNTNAFRAGTPREWLNTYTDLLTFARRTGILESKALNALESRAQQSPDEAARVTALARDWREALYRIAVTRARDDATFDQINQVILEGNRHRDIVRIGPDQYAWHWPAERLEQPLWIIAFNAAELLISGMVVKVRTCPGHDCGWVFLDAGRGKPRRWCAMDLCGNREKIKRFRSKEE
jgi:predicted RNA-binding Zn ribbon-like protein